MRSCFLLLVALSFVSNPGVAKGQGDFFWSTALPGSGDVVNDDLEVNIGLGESRAIHLYWSTSGPLNSQLRVGAALDISTSQPGIIAFDSAETYDFDIVLADDPSIVVGRRWQDNAGGGYAGPAINGFSDDFIDRFAAWSILEPGIDNINTGPNLLDTGYDSTADAFLFGSVDFVGNSLGKVDLIPEADKLGIVDTNFLLNDLVTFGNVTINVVPIPEPTTMVVFFAATMALGCRRVR